MPDGQVVRTLGPSLGSRLWSAELARALTVSPASVLVAQSRLSLCDPLDCSALGFPVHGILQARILEWVAMPSSRGSS